MRDRPRLVAVVFVVSLAIRALASILAVPAWETSNRILPFPDRYPVLAASILDDRSLGYAPEGATPTTTRGPGFPAFLALGMVAGGRSARWVALWASLPGAAGAALVAWLLFPSAGERGALVGGFVAGAHPLPVFTSARGMADEFVGVLLLGAVAVAFVGWTGRRERAHAAAYEIGAGLFLGAAMLTRATAVLGLVAVVVVGILTLRKMFPLVVLAATALLPPLAWSVRSSALEGRPVFVHSLAAYNWWCGEVMDARGLSGRGGELRTSMAETVIARGGFDTDPSRFWYGTLTPRETARLESNLGRAAVARVREDPVAYSGRVARGLAWFWTRGDTRNRTLQYSLLVLPVVALGAWGGLRARGGGRFDRDLALAAVLMIGLHTLAYAAVYPSARFAVQVWPALAWLTGWGAARR